MSNIKNRGPKKQNNTMLKMKILSLKKSFYGKAFLMVFKVGCIRPCERKGKNQANISFYHVKKRGDYQTHFYTF